MMDKNELREKYKKLRAGISAAQIDEMSMAIANNALQMNIWDKTYYHIFLPIVKKKEVQTEFLLHILQGRDKSVVLPKTDFKSGEIISYLLQENTKLVTSKFGITEPENGIEIPPNNIEVVFVPLLAYDLQGNRVGYGGGFYDRFLAKCNPDTIKIGLSFFEPEFKIIHENIDIAVNYCITPQKILSF